MNQLNQLLLTVIILSIYSSSAKAQSLNDEFKMKLRESLTAPPELPPAIRSKVPNIELQQENKILKVSPTTKLPTKFDKIITTPRPEIKLNLKTTNSSPYNVRPRGSSEFVFDGRQMRIMSTAGQTVVPTGRNFGSSTKKDRQYQKVKKLMKAYRD